MSCKLNRSAYQRLIDENIAWLMKFPRTLEREHTIFVLRDSVRCHYDEKLFPSPEAIERVSQETRHWHMEKYDGADPFEVLDEFVKRLALAARER